MQSTRARIIDLLRRRRETTVEELTRDLEMAPATVRRHLDVLQRDGKVTLRAVRRGSGRPYFAFSLSESGAEELGEHHIRVTTRLLENLTALRPGETRGRSGRELALLVFKRMAHETATSCGHRVTARRLEERLAQALQALADEGVVFEMTRRPSGYLIEARSCPCRRLRGAHEAVCVYDRELLARLFDAPVETAGVETTATGCAYFVREGVL